MFPERVGRILSQFPVVVKRFHQMVLDDYLSAVAGFNKGSQANWAARFEADDDMKLEEPNAYHINYARQALSFVNTDSGIISYGMLEAIGWWTPLSPAPRSVLHLAALVLRQLGLRYDVSMSHMMSFGIVFLCVRCGCKERMSWISLVSAA